MTLDGGHARVEPLGPADPTSGPTYATAATVYQNYLTQMNQGLTRGRRPTASLARVTDDVLESTPGVKALQKQLSWVLMWTGLQNDASGPSPAASAATSTAGPADCRLVYVSDARTGAFITAYQDCAG